MSTATEILSQANHKLGLHLDEQIAHVEKEISVLRDAASKLQGELRTELESQLDSLGSVQKKAKDKLDELRSTGADAWEDVKVGAEMVVADLRATLDSVATRFKGQLH